MEEAEATKKRRANRGIYQRFQKEIRLRDLEKVSSMTLQCGVENSKLDDRKREVIRECDPMIPWRRLISPENRMVCRYHGDSDEPYVMY